MTVAAPSYVAYIEAKMQAAAEADHLAVAEAELEADPEWEVLGAVTEAEQSRRRWRP